MTLSRLVKTELDCVTILFITIISLIGCTDNRSASHEEVRDTHLIKSCSFVGHDKAWLVTANEGNLLWTKNAGKDWSTVAGTVVGGRFESVGFVDDAMGLAVNSEGRIWKTGDGGENWTPMAQISAVRPREWNFGSSDQVKLADESRAWIIETFTIWRTDDGGSTWRQVFSEADLEKSGQPVSFFSLNRDTAWNVTSKGQIYLTRDAGNHWDAVHIGDNVNAKEVFFINQQVGWVLGFSGVSPYSTLYRSEDAGKKWTGSALPIPNAVIESVSFVSEREGWVAGRIWTGDQKNSEGVLLHTKDGGKSWQRLQLPQPERFFYGVHFSDLQHGWLIANNNVYLTDDSGNNWRSVLSLPPQQDMK